MKEKLIGKWLSCDWRSSHTEWIPENADFIRLVVLNSDGTAEDKCAKLEDDDESPISAVWEFREPDQLILYTPVGPIPEAEIFEWSREEFAYTIFSLNDKELILDKSGEILTRFRRIT